MRSQTNSEAVKRLLDSLQSDLKTLSLETKRKHPSVKESAEEAIVKIRNAGLSNSNTPLAYLSNQILYPLVQVRHNKHHSEHFIKPELFFRAARRKTPK